MPVGPGTTDPRRTAAISLGAVGAVVLASVLALTTFHHHQAPGTTAAGTTTSTSLAPTTTTTTTLPAPLRFPVHGKLRVLEIGDSLGTDLGGGLSVQLEKSPRVKLIIRGKTDTGLSNSWYYNWPRHLRHFLHEYQPQLLIVFLGANDEQAMNVKGTRAPFDSPLWISRYRASVTSILHEARTARCEVLWVGLPIMDPNGYRQGIESINSIFAQAAQGVPGVTFIPTWDYFADAQGQFRFAAKVNGTRQALRAPDGIHFTALGQSVLATYVVDQMRSLYALAVKPAYPQRFTK
jgi:uncharacterized protein